MGDAISFPTRGRGPKSRRTAHATSRWLLLPTALAVLITCLLLPNKRALRRLKQRVEQATKCGSETEYLCYSLRPVIDAGFKGDVHAMRHIIAKQLDAQPEPKRAPTRGIVMAAGGRSYIANAFVNMRVLRHHLNCTLPVAIMYWGAAAQDAITRSTQAFLEEHITNIHLIDASNLSYPPHHRWLFPPDSPEHFNGWKVKVFAAYAAPFDEVLVLDGDATPLQDPEPLFRHPAYLEHGNMFWPDAWCKRVELFGRAGLRDPWRDARGRVVWQAETGQFMLNRRKHRDVLEWLLFLNTHDEFTYFWGYGDKDTFLASFMLAGKEASYYQVPQPLSLPLYGHLRRRANMRVQGLLQHHPDSSLLFLHRAGFRGRKYDPDRDQRKPVSHVMAQPGCEWNRRNQPFQEFIPLRESGQPVFTPDTCPYELDSIAASLAACGMEHLQADMVTGQASRPPIFEVGPTMALAQVQQAADAAFQLLRRAKQSDNSLF